MDIKLDASTRMMTETVNNLGKLITKNAEFDQVGQVMTLGRLEGEEMLSIIRSMEHGQLDRAAEREAGKVASRVASRAAKGMTASAVQDYISMVTRSQGSVIDINHVGDSRMFKDSTRKVTLVTPEPLIDGAVAFMEVSENIYISTAKVTDGIKYYVNTYNSMGTIFQMNGKTMKLIPRVIQVYPGTRLVFRKPENDLTDQFTVYFSDREEVTLGTQCGDVQKGVLIKNGSTVSIPLQCTDQVFYIRAVDLFKEAKHNLESNMLDRETMHPIFPVLVHKNDVENSLNKTIKIWSDISADKIRLLHEKHGREHNKTWTYTTSITSGVIGCVFLITFAVVAHQILECKKKKRTIPTAPALERGFLNADANNMATVMAKRFLLLQIEHHAQIKELYLKKEFACLLNQAPARRELAETDEIPLIKVQQFRIK